MNTISTSIQEMNAYKSLKEVVGAEKALELIESLTDLDTFLPTASGIVTMVTWSDTPQGVDFWRNLYNVEVKLKGSQYK